MYLGKSSREGFIMQKCGASFLCREYTQKKKNKKKTKKKQKKQTHSHTGFDTRSGNILSFLLLLFQEGQLSVTGESMCTKYWLTA